MSAALGFGRANVVPITAPLQVMPPLTLCGMGVWSGLVYTAWVTEGKVFRGRENNDISEEPDNGNQRGL